jgi:hypothetical protein
MIIGSQMRGERADSRGGAATSRLTAHAERLAAIAQTKRAMLPVTRCGLSKIARAEREADIATIEFAHRVFAVMAKAPDEFAVWFRTNAGTPL